jgi:L-lactate dehydrogenase complex protein LldE
LESPADFQIGELPRSDDCCGFGGTFAIGEKAVSGMMGQDRIADHESAGTDFLTANDMSRLMHMKGLIRRISSVVFRAYSDTVDCAAA